MRIFLPTHARCKCKLAIYIRAHLREGQSNGNAACPMTRRPIQNVVEVPDVREDPVGWFQIVDNDGNGRLSKKEIVEVRTFVFCVHHESIIIFVGV